MASTTSGRAVALQLALDIARYCKTNDVPVPAHITEYTDATKQKNPQSTQRYVRDYEQYRRASSRFSRAATPPSPSILRPSCSGLDCPSPTNMAAQLAEPDAEPRKARRDRKRRADELQKRKHGRPVRKSAAAASSNPRLHLDTNTTTNNDKTSALKSTEHAQPHPHDHPTSPPRATTSPSSPTSPSVRKLLEENSRLAEKVETYVDLIEKLRSGSDEEAQELLCRLRDPDRRDDGAARAVRGEVGDGEGWRGDGEGVRSMDERRDERMDERREGREERERREEGKARRAREESEKEKSPWDWISYPSTSAMSSDE
ncbi:hypothetical protein LTR66_007236 [Elasticomyces elasticus]|nr:hypothetical protein LTR66_007236 [Elasticomyces elasticus]